MDWKFEGLMKVLEEMTCNYKYLEEGESQGKNRILVECLKDNDIELPSIHQASDADYCERKF